MCSILSNLFRACVITVLKAMLALNVVNDIEPQTLTFFPRTTHLCLNPVYMGSTSARKRVWFVFKHFVLFCAAVGQLTTPYTSVLQKQFSQN